MQKEKHMTAIKSIAFCVGWIITANIGLWAMAIYWAFFAWIGLVSSDRISDEKIF